MSRLFNILKAIIDRVRVDYIVDQGETNGWMWRKWNSGRYEAERVSNVGQYTINTSVISGSVMSGGTIQMPSLPHTLERGRIEITSLGNDSNSGVWVEILNNSSWRICKASSATVTIQNMTVAQRVVGGKWK